MDSMGLGCPPSPTHGAVRGSDDLRSARTTLVQLVLVALSLTVPALAQFPRAPYVTTPLDVVDRILALANVGANDVVYDLGSGDGRIVIAAAQKFGARGVGIDIDQARVDEATLNARRAGVDDLVHFERGDAFEADVAAATVLTVYLSSALNVKLRPRITAQLRRGARIVSHNFGMGDWDPDTVDTFTDSTGRSRTLYLWIAEGRVRP